MIKSQKYHCHTGLKYPMTKCPAVTASNPTHPVTSIPK